MVRGGCGPASCSRRLDTIGSQYHGIRRDTIQDDSVLMALKVYTLIDVRCTPELVANPCRS